MLISTLPSLKDDLRDNITQAYRMDETACIDHLLSTLTDITSSNNAQITKIAKKLAMDARHYHMSQGKIEGLLHQYDLSSEEGIALMCLAEALLRIPDKATIDKIINDKLTNANWKNHLASDNTLFVNAASWSLLLTGKMYGARFKENHNLFGLLNQAIGKLGVLLTRPLILRMMQIIGKQFVIGENIQSALKNSLPLEKKGYRFSYDMLGEAARTRKEAARYYQTYIEAIEAIGKISSKDKLITNPSISIKLSALHPRFEFAKHDELLSDLPPLLLKLATVAKTFGIALTIDAEEADRLDLSLDIFQKVFTHPSLAHWDGLGLAVQAYQKRALYVIDWLYALADKNYKRIMVRLVKGAYWDAEIKSTQVQGLSNYPVFTRKNATDVSYLACAKRLLSSSKHFYSQFGTHNAYSVAAIIEMAKMNDNHHFEFQCLQSMGRGLYDNVIDPAQFNLPCRIYAPVGTHRDLLGYLIRRLLENGANSSFINQLADKAYPLEKIITDPVLRLTQLKQKSHPLIPLPKNIYVEWQNSQGIDFSNRETLIAAKSECDEMTQKTWQAVPLINGEAFITSETIPVYAPGQIEEVIGHVSLSEEKHVDAALEAATLGTKKWAATSIFERANYLEQAATLFQQSMLQFATMISKEAGRTLPDAVSEVREAIDYCRYYAYLARKTLITVSLPAPTGELNQLSLHPRGVIACISPWNFPLAILTGQIVAALVTGNTVVAKPAAQTPLIAFKAVQLLHQAGIPKEALHLLTGAGKIGAQMVNDPRIDGVVFTGSTETAKNIEQSLAKHKGVILPLIAETGGQNAMIVDSSALLEQTVIDIAQSAFNSAGQRCSALRVLFVQEEIATQLITMLQGYMQELAVGDPSLLKTDIGPLIDREALEKLHSHVNRLKTGQNKSNAATLLAEVPMGKTPKGHYFSPCVFELTSIHELKGEVFGPILHVIRYSENELDQVIADIISMGYGLTFGIQSRIDSTVQYVTERIPVGNLYVNRNMIGAVVGVQPFGGERLSGTGPKAGGPHYLTRLCVERTRSVNTAAFGGNARLVSLHEDD